MLGTFQIFGVALVFGGIPIAMLGFFGWLVHTNECNPKHLVIQGVIMATLGCVLLGVS